MKCPNCNAILNKEMVHEVIKRVTAYVESDFAKGKISHEVYEECKKYLEIET